MLGALGALGSVLGAVGAFSGDEQRQSVSKTGPWEAQQKYLKDIFGKAQSLYNTPYGQQFNSALNQERNDLANGNSAIDKSQGILSQLLQGDTYKTAMGQGLDPNSAMYKKNYAMATQPVIDTFNNTVRPSIDASANMAGRLGSGAYGRARNTADQTLTKALGDVSTNMYNTERGRQMQATQMLSGLAGQNAGFQGLKTDRLGQIDPNNMNMQRLGQYSGLVKGNYGGTSSTPYYMPNSRQQAGGLLMQGAGLAKKLGWGG